MKNLIRWILNHIPRTVLQRLASWAVPVMGLLYVGRGKECPVCGCRRRKFLPYGYVTSRENALCPRCLALERHRLIWLWIESETDLTSRPQSMLHIAPEVALMRKFKQIYADNKELYVTADLESPLATLHFDVQHIPLADEQFDIIICNPPTDFVEKGTTEAKRAGGVTQVKISAAYLFAKMAGKHLEENGRLVIMLPTTVASASALTSFRREMAENLALDKIHLFIGKQKNDKRAIPLKKSIILSYGKCPKPTTVTVTTSTDWGKPENTVMLPALDYSFVVDEKDGTLTLPKSVEETKIVQYIAGFPETLTSLGLKMSTGLVIDSRCEGMLFTEPIKGCIPLIRPTAIRGGQIRFPMPIKHQYIAPLHSSLMQKNKNMVIVKRVPAKSDERFVNAAIYMASQLPQYKYISTHNKINFIDTKEKDGEMCARLVFGLFALLNSTIYDRYLSIVSKSKQINSKEMKDLPLPPRNIIENMGMRLMSLRQASVAACDSVVNPTLHLKTK